MVSVVMHFLMLGALCLPTVASADPYPADTVWTDARALGIQGRGWPEAAPFDRIILTCAPPVIPDMLLNQLKIGGIMVAPVGRDRNQQLVTIRRSEAGFEEATLLPVKFVPLVED